VLLGGLNAALEGAARQLAKELAPIRVNVISPGLVRSDAYAAMPEDQREAMYATRTKVLPVGRIGALADIAIAAVHLMKNSYITGVVQDIDGGGLLG
jgi:NAD(P)-dependent dehydrogenase (short-subunit alcohol dehydrogenase family)